MRFWKKQDKTEMQMRFSYVIKKAISQLEKRRAQLEKLFRQKYIAAQEAKTLGDKEAAIRFLEECQLITDEQTDLKKEISKFNRAESLIEHLIILPEVSELLGTTSSSEDIDPARALDIMSNLEQHISQIREADEKLGTLPVGIGIQEPPAPPMEETTESDFHQESFQETESNTVRSEDMIDSNKKNQDASKKGKEVEL